MSNGRLAPDEGEDYIKTDTFFLNHDNQMILENKIKKSMLPL